MKAKLLLIIILFQLILVVFFGVQIYNKTNNKKVSISYIDKNSINIKGTQSLKYFYELRPAITKIDKVNWLEKEATYTFNNDALNERFDYPVEKPKDVFRIITLGDSFTFGKYVNTKDNWTELVEDKFNNKCNKNYKFEVINLGVSGYDVEYEVERYQIRGQKYNPDLLLWMLFDNERNKELTQQTINDCIEINPTTTIDNEINQICLRVARKELEEKYGKQYISSRIIQNFNKIFDLYTKKIIAIDLNGSHKEILKNISKPKQVDIFNYDFIDKKYKLLDSHPNQAGHKRIAEDVFDYLMKNKLIPCN